MNICFVLLSLLRSQDLGDALYFVLSNSQESLNALFGVKGVIFRDVVRLLFLLLQNCAHTFCLIF